MKEKKQKCIKYEEKKNDTSRNVKKHFRIIKLCPKSTISRFLKELTRKTFLQRNFLSRRKMTNEYSVYFGNLIRGSKEDHLLPLSFLD